MVTSIFIQIPSYRDHELPRTVCDAITKWSHKTHISFGIHSCVLPQDEIRMTCASSGGPGSPSSVKICHVESVAPTNIGLQMGRYIANSLYWGEDYYLQIDSHMRFVQDWDIKLVAMIEAYRQAGIPKPLITMYPPTYTLDLNGETVLHGSPSFYSTRISFAETPNQFTQALIPSQLATPMDDGCVFTSSVSGGFVFADGPFSEITPNRLIAFWGEEILIAARAFTHGFDLVTATGSLTCNTNTSILEFATGEAVNGTFSTASTRHK